MRSWSDARLVRAARDGSVDAAGELFSRHWPGAWRAAYAVTGRRSLADDVAQDAFERAFGALARFDERRPFAPWLHRIVVNRAIDWGRREALRRGAGDAEDRAAPSHADKPGTELMAALAELPPEQRAVVVLRYLLEYTPGEIGRMLELPRGTVNSRLRRGLDRLRDLIEVGG
jgi:RNA polymerase sigma-70 factor (ECF subfamily)